MWTFTTAHLTTLLSVTFMAGSFLGLIVAALLTASSEEHKAIEASAAPVKVFPPADFPDRRARMERIARTNPRIQ